MTCPTSETLSLFLSGCASDAAAVEAHLDGCPTCRLALDEMSDNAELRRWLPRALALHPRQDDTVVGLVAIDLAAKASQDLGADTVETSGDERAPEFPSRDRYTLARLHASGGLGRVWLAHDSRLGRDVALKELRPERAGQPRMGERFLKEAQITGQLEHPGIVPIYELGRRAEDGQPFYTMRFVRGRTLAEAAADYHRKRQQGEALARELRELLSAVVSVCNAVAYAHSRGVLHRDLKPHNVVLGDFGEVMVLDWGLAQLQSDLAESEQPPVALEGTAAEQTSDGQVLGTPGYMAPEQAQGRGARLDARTDVYGLGAIMYHVLTGRPPFAAADAHAVVRQVLHDTPPRPRTLVPAVPAGLEAVCLKALARLPEDRYASAKDLADEIQRWLADEPVHACRELLTVRMGRWARRHRSVVWAVLAASVALALGAVAATWQAVVATQAQQEAETAAKAEEAARTLAQAKEAEAKDVLDFVQDHVFAAARPEGVAGGLGHHVSLRRAMEAALPVMAGRFADQPLTEARLRMTMGRSFEYLGEHRIAAEQYERARFLYQQHLGPDHADTLRSMHRLAPCFLELGRIPDALKLAEETLARRKATLGIDHVDTLASLNYVAGLYLADGRNAQALTYYDEALARSKATLGADHPTTLKSMSSLARAYNILHRYADAIQLYEETVPLLRSTMGADDPTTLAVSEGLALSYMGQRRPADAVQLYGELLPIAKAKLGPAHPLTLHVMWSYAQGLEASHRPDEALKLLQEALTVSTAKRGRADEHTLQVMQNLANLYRTLGRQADAAGLETERLGLVRALRAAEGPKTVGP